MLKKYKWVLSGCNEPEKDISGYQWNLVSMKDVITEQLWTWSKVDSSDGSVYLYLGTDRGSDLAKELWFKLRKSV